MPPQPRSPARSIPMPPGIDYRNGGCSTPCDTLDGPCACGAWHDLAEWGRRAIGGVPVAEVVAAMEVDGRLEIPHG